MYSNGLRLFSLKKLSNNESIDCLNGIRVLTLIWLIWGHAYVNRFIVPNVNMIEILEVKLNFEYFLFKRSMLCISINVTYIIICIS